MTTTQLKPKTMVIRRRDRKMNNQTIREEFIPKSITKNPQLNLSFSWMRIQVKGWPEKSRSIRLLSSIKLAKTIVEVDS